MPQITDIKRQKKNPKRFSVYIDGKFSFGLDADNLVKSGLEVSQEISQEEIEKMVKENEFFKIYEQVLKFFSYRPRSEKELRDWFKKKEVGEEVQKLICQKLKQVGLLNDEEFAKWWIEQRTAFRPSGLRLLALELRQKGISKDLISKLLNCYIPKDAEYELVKKAVEKKLKSLRHLSDLELRKKLGAFLSRRGFSFAVIKKIIGEIKSFSL